MYVLHLSDLHVGKGENLDYVWCAHESLLHYKKRDRFDFVVISGDLTAEAKKQEYEDLRNVLESHTVPQVADRSRIIIVPGNHDVDWTKPIAALADSLETAELNKALLGYRTNPARSQLRSFENDGQQQWRFIDPNLYPARFENVQAFLDDFYRDVSSDNYRPFKLTGKPDDHFSAHLFKDERVAFFGFNSCEGNDKYWCGAAIHDKAIVAARRFIKEHQLEGWLLVAVWHHGFSAEPSHPDRLTWKNKVDLSHQGFVIGFHGHTHKEESEAVVELRQPMAVISTGSLGAESKERPDAVGNQFSIACISERSVHVEFYAKDVNGQYSFDKHTTLELTGGPTRSGADIRARVHERAWEIGNLGITTTLVKVDGIRGGTELPLAVLMKPFCEAIVTKKPNRHQLLDQRPLPDRKVFVAKASSVRTGPDSPWHGGVEFQYAVSNAVALSVAELAMFPSTRKSHPELNDGLEVVIHTVRFKCDLLRLRLRFDQGAGVQPVDVAALVEERKDTLFGPQWLRVTWEEERLEPRKENGGHVLEIKCPIVGRRYGMSFSLSEDGTPYEEQTQILAEEIIEICQERKSALRKGLTACVRDAVRDAMKMDKSAKLLLNLEAGAWVAYLWDHNKEEALVPCFGEFRPTSWAVRFPFGQGLIGNAHRFGAISLWHRDGGPASSLIYTPNPEKDRLGQSYLWIVGIPLRMFEGDLAIGAIAFASKSKRGKLERRLSNLARSICSGDEKARSNDLLSQLDYRINAAFWAGIRDSDEMLGGHRKTAGRVLERLLQNADASAK